MGSEKQLEQVNLNKLNDREVTVVKKIMDQKFAMNKVRPGDPGYQYDIQKEFDPEESNEWDKSQNKKNLSPMGHTPGQTLGPSIVRNNTVEPPAQVAATKIPEAHQPTKSRNIGMGDEEFDIDFDEDFNDDLDDFDE